MKLIIATILLALFSINVNAAEGYASPDAKYAKVCTNEAKEKILPILKTYAEVGGWDYGDMVNDKVTYPTAFKNPSWPQQYLHPIEFTALLSRGVETRIRAIFANSDANDPNMCVFMGVEILDLTSAN